MLSKFKWGVTFFMVSLLALIGCQSEKMVDDMGSQTGQTVTLIAKHASGSRTAIKNGKTEWVVGDKIYVSSQNGDARGTLTCINIEDDGDGVFTGQIMGTLEGKKAYSVYPAPVNGKTINLAGTTGAQYPNAPMIGKITNGNITFQNTCGVLYLNLNGVQGETLEISAFNGNTPISLAAKADVTNCWPKDADEPSLAFGDETSEKITIYKAHGGEMYVPFYIANCKGLSNVKFKVGDQELNKEGWINLSGGVVGKLVKNNIATFTLSENGTFVVNKEVKVEVDKNGKATSEIVAKDLTSNSYFTVSGTAAPSTGEGGTAVTEMSVTLPKVNNENQTAEISFTDMASVKTITISETEDTGNSIEELTVVIPSDITAEQAQQKVTISMPNTTVTVKSADGNVLFIKEMTASTAPNTLVVDKDVKIGELTVTKGSVQVFGEIGKLIHAAGEGVVINIYIMESGHITTPPDSNKFNVLFQTQGGGHSTKAGGNGFENGGIFFKTSNDSRASIELGNQAEDGESFDWKEGDKFTLIEIVDDSQPEVTVTPKVHEFTISDSYSNDSPSGGADFTSPTALTYLAQFVAFYPVVKEDESGYNFYFNNTLKDNSAESWNNYFKNNMFMKATGNSVPSDQMGLNFQQMCSLIRITYTNATNAARNIKRISVDGSWGSGFHVDKNSLEPMACSGEEDYGVTFTDGATIGVDETVDFYILYFPYRDYNEVTPENELSQMKKVSIETFDGHKLYTPDYLFDEDNTPDFLRGTGKRFWFSVTETADGLKWTDSLNEEPGEGDEPGEGGDNEGDGEEGDDVTYPTVKEGSFLIKDKGFSQALYDILNKQNGQFIQMVDGYAIIDMDFANNYQGEFDFERNKYTIKSLRGIEHFKNISRLYAPDLNLEGTCDLSHNTQLTSIGITNNILDEMKMTSIIIGENKRLTHVDVSGNNLTSLDLSGAPNLWAIYCSQNKNLSELTLSSQCTRLETLSISNTKLTAIDIPNPAGLKMLYISNMDNLSIDWNDFSSLKELECDGMNQRFIDAIPDGVKEKLTAFWCRYSELTSLNMFPFKSLKWFACTDNHLETLNVSHLTQLEELDCVGNKLTYLDLSAINSLKDLSCGNQTNGELDQYNRPVYIQLTLVLSTAMQERWDEEWIDAWSHKDEHGNALVILDTTGNTGENSVGGSDFTYGDNNIW